MVIFSVLSNWIPNPILRLLKAWICFPPVFLLNFIRFWEINCKIVFRKMFRGSPILGLLYKGASTKIASRKFEQKGFTRKFETIIAVIFDEMQEFAIFIFFTPIDRIKKIFKNYSINLTLFWRKLTLRNSNEI